MLFSKRQSIIRTHGHSRVYRTFSMILVSVRGGGCEYLSFYFHNWYLAVNTKTCKQAISTKQLISWTTSSARHRSYCCVCFVFVLNDERQHHHTNVLTSRFGLTLTIDIMHFYNSLRASQNCFIEKVFKWYI